VVAKVAKVAKVDSLKIIEGYNLPVPLSHCYAASVLAQFGKFFRAEPGAVGCISADKIHHLADLRSENVEPSDSFTGAAAGTLSWLMICDMF
jgi:hypothetical protein